MEFSLFEWFRRRKQPYDEVHILNDGMHYAMEFGSNWLKPIQSRLVKLYPKLSEVELNKFNETCQKAMKGGHLIVYNIAEQENRLISFEEFIPIASKSFPWLNQKSLKHLYSQGCYYTWKDFGPLK